MLNNKGEVVKVIRMLIINRIQIMKPRGYYVALVLEAARKLKLNLYQTYS